MLEILTGTGLASAAGLNAYVPLLTVGIIARYTELLPLGPGWQWLEHPAVLAILGVLLALEVAADKIPAVDSLNDAVQTVVRPTSGGITFGAGASSATATEIASLAGGDAGGAGGDGGAAWWQIAAGVLIALAFHLLKASARPVLNAVTFGAGGPVVSVVEDAASVLTSVAAVLVPVVAVVAVVLMAAVGVWARQRRRRRRRERRSSAAPHIP
ncbi:DUF4126 domain-containing protein [Streptomonospora wellingtoniae]|uniref:DUF4126 domain-containing protein n=1 Tax=Streptomonospora wellingtoniae TaxID=3075544 RepID=A0ABU2KP85_9ACTN|nr:DUF4126 domain-containing protein [Streptomonospora sp. DSM 45055]MDT0300968.1 DUF4126 domain-containing protein [Streptomonospora sp. DSM 45055]